MVNYLIFNSDYNNEIVSSSPNLLLWEYHKSYQDIKANFLDPYVKIIPTVIQAADIDCQLALSLEMDSYMNIENFIKSSSNYTNPELRLAIANLIKEKEESFTTITKQYNQAVKNINETVKELESFVPTALQTSNANQISNQCKSIGKKVAYRITKYLASANGIVNFDNLTSEDITKLNVFGFGDTEKQQLISYINERRNLKIDMSNRINSLNMEIEKFNPSLELNYLDQKLNTPIMKGIGDTVGSLLDFIQLADSMLTVYNKQYNIKNLCDGISALAGLAELSKLAGRTTQIIMLADGIKTNVENITNLISLYEDARHWSQAYVDKSENLLNPLQMKNFYTDIANSIITEFSISMLSLEDALKSRDIEMLATHLNNLEITINFANEIKNKDTMGYLVSGFSFSGPALLGLSVEPITVNEFDKIVELKGEGINLISTYWFKLYNHEIYNDTFRSINQIKADNTQNQNDFLMWYNGFNHALENINDNPPYLEIRVINPDKSSILPDNPPGDIYFYGEKNSSVFIKFFYTPEELSLIVNGQDIYSGKIYIFLKKKDNNGCWIEATRIDLNKLQLLSLPDEGLWKLVEIKVEMDNEDFCLSNDLCYMYYKLLTIQWIIGQSPDENNDFSKLEKTHVTLIKENLLNGTYHIGPTQKKWTFQVGIYPLYNAKAIEVSSDEFMGIDQNEIYIGDVTANSSFEVLININPTHNGNAAKKSVWKLINGNTNEDIQITNSFNNTFDINILTNMPPEFSPLQLTSIGGSINETIKLQIECIDPESDPIKFSIEGIGTIDKNNSFSASFQKAGVYQINILANDGYVNSLQTIYAIIYDSIGLNENDLFEDIKFSGDVDINSSYSAIQYLGLNGIVIGEPNGSKRIFKPNQPIIQAEAIKMIMKSAAYRDFIELNNAPRYFQNLYIIDEAKNIFQNYGWASKYILKAEEIRMIDNAEEWLPFLSITKIEIAKWLSQMFSLSIPEQLKLVSI